MSWHLLDLNGDGYGDSYGWDGDRDGRYEQTWVNTDRDSGWEIILYDSNDDGRNDAALADADNNGSYDVWLLDSDMDGRIGDYMLWDTDHNGRFEVQTFDSNEDTRAEWIRLDTNGDGHADTWRSVAELSQPAPASSSQNTAAAAAANRAAVERINTQHIVTMGQLNIYGTRIFG